MLIAALLCLPQRSNAQIPSRSSAEQCGALSASDFLGTPDAPAQVTRAKWAVRVDDIPPFCQVSGYVAPSVGFELRLPENWNRKFVQLGCGGHCGIIFPSGCDNMLRRGYACVVTDMGHEGAGALWANNNLQAKIDFGYRSAHVVALAGKAIAESYYAKRPAKSYFMGCSTGGRQALQEAQRFPWDFDGIIAGAPPIRLADLYITFAWSLRATHDANGKPLLGTADLKLLTDAAVAKCDMDDGVKDGIISRPLSCSFRPAEIQCKEGQRSGCLTPTQVKAAERVFTGPTDSAGKPLYEGGALPGANWEKFYLDVDGKPSYLYDLTEQGLRYLFFPADPGPDWKLADLRFEEDYKRLNVSQSLYDSSNPDLTRFKTAGGKLMIYIGMNDVSIPRSVIEYYENVERVSGGRKPTQDFARLFTLPGVEHCATGPGADTIDYLTYLEDWVERGNPPDKLIAYHLKADRSGSRPSPLIFPLAEQLIEFSRPVYPYPTTARYLGHGDPKDANNFGPVEP